MDGHGIASIARQKAHQTAVDDVRTDQVEGQIGDATALFHDGALGFIAVQLQTSGNSRGDSGSVPEFMEMPLDAVMADIKSGKLKVPLGPTVQLSDIVVAHRWMQQNQAAGKIVVTIP